MEIRIEDVPGTLPAGCFIGVRIAEMLKQRRYDSGCSYTFPKVERRRNAKIDVYRHIGTCNAIVDPEAETDKVISVGVLDPAVSEMKLRVSATAKSPPANKPPDTIRSEAKKSAMDYLTTHQLEEKLADAMKVLLVKRPDDPLEFICQYLRSTASPPPSSPVAAKPSPAAVLPFAGYYKRYVAPCAGVDFWKSVHSKFPPVKKTSLAASAPPALKAVAVASVLPFAGYYKCNVAPRAGIDFWKSVHSKFPPVKKTSLAASAPPAPKAVAVSKASFAITPSVGTWMRSKPAKLAVKKPAAVPQQVKAAWNLEGFLPGSSHSWDVRFEVERAVTKALLELTGEFAGQYYPLPASHSYFPCPGGMSTEEQSLLNGSSLLFQKADSQGCGVFANTAKDMAVWVNEDHHIQVIVNQNGKSVEESIAQLHHAEAAVRAALQQDGYSLSEPMKLERNLKGLSSPATMAQDERLEAERVLTKAFMELTGTLEGEYYPMRTSTSYLSKPGGMTEEEEKANLFGGMILRTFEASGCGVFTTYSDSISILVNGDCHLQLVLKKALATRKESEATLRFVEAALSEALRQDGYALV